MIDEHRLKDLLRRAAEIKKDNKLDLSSDEDLSIAVMNLVSLEEHFFFTGAKTGKPAYYDLLAQVREIRKGLLKKIIKDAEGEVWCISKHLLAASMRLMEVGTKYYSQDNKKEAEELFAKAYDLFSLFWGLNLKIIDLGEVKKVGEDQLNIHDQSAGGQKDKALMAGLNTLVQKLVDCCKE